MKKKNNIHGFKTPKSYFDNFEEELFNKLEEEKLPPNTGFMVPQAYFDTFEDRLFEKIDSDESRPKVIQLFRNRKLMYATAIAASLALLFVLVGPDSNLPDQIDKLQLSSIENYIDEGNLEYNDLEIMALMDEEEVLNLTIDEDLISEESLEDYLLENIDDTTLFIE